MEAEGMRKKKRRLREGGEGRREMKGDWKQRNRELNIKCC